MNPNTILKFAIVILCLCGHVCAQMNGPANWKSLVSEEDNFSISIPTDFETFSDEEGYSKVTLLGRGMNSGKTGIWNYFYKNINHVTSNYKDVSLSVSRYETRKNPYALELYSRPFIRDMEATPMNGDRFSGKVAVATSENWYFVQVIIYRKARIFHVRAAARRENDTLKYFLNSLKIDGKSLFQLKIKTNEQTIGLVKFVTQDVSPFNSIVLPNIDKNVVEGLAKRMLPEDASSIVSMPDEFKDIDMKMPPFHRVLMRVTFAANGKISFAELVNKNPDSRIGKRALAAVRQIRFIPRLKDGKPEEFVRLMEYRSYEK